MGFLLVSAQQDTRGQLGVYALAFAPFALCWAATGVYTGALISQWEIAVATGSVLWRGAGALAGFVGGVLGGGLVSVAVGISAGEAARLWWLKRRTRRQIQDPPRGVPEGPAALRQAAGAQVLASIAGSAVLVVERLMARTLGPGNISHLEYATRLLVIPTLFFDGGLAPLLLARWTNRLTGGSDELHQQEVWRPLMKGVLLALGCGALLALLAPTFVAIVLRHGRFSAADASAVAVLLRVLAIGFVGSMGATLLERLFLAGSRNRTLAMLSVIRAVSRVGVAFALLGAKGLLAFGVGYSASEWLYFAILIYLTRTGRAAGTAFRIA
jgi:putative peptidoglycan lipid II flippase